MIIKENSALEIIVNKVGTLLNTETELYTSRKGSRSLMGIKTESGYDACVDIDFVIKQSKSESDLLENLTDAAKRAIFERDKSRRYVKGENIDFSGYQPMEAKEMDNQVKNTHFAYEDHEEDRSC